MQFVDIGTAITLVLNIFVMCLLITLYAKQRKTPSKWGCRDFVTWLAIICSLACAALNGLVIWYQP